MSFATTTHVVFSRLHPRNRRPGVIVAAALSAALLLAFGFTGLAHATTYHFITLGDTVTDANFNQLLGINNEDIIVGYSGDGTVRPNKGYLMVPRGHFAPENYPGSDQTQVTGIESHIPATFPFTFVVTVGFWVDGNGDNKGFYNMNAHYNSVVFPGTPLFKGTRTNQLLGVNDNLHAVGFWIDGKGNSHGYTYAIETDTYTKINLPFQSVMSFQATGINHDGVICGFYVDSHNNTHGFYGKPGSFKRVDVSTSLGTGTTFLGINDNNLLVGFVTSAAGGARGLIYNSKTGTGSIVDDPDQSSKTNKFGTNGTVINGINDHNEIVGFYGNGTKTLGFFASP